jgi:hypothetical protein
VISPIKLLTMLFATWSTLLRSPSCGAIPLKFNYLFQPADSKSLQITQNVKIPKRVEMSELIRFNQLDFNHDSVLLPVIRFKALWCNQWLCDIIFAFVWNHLWLQCLWVLFVHDQRTN